MKYCYCIFFVFYFGKIFAQDAKEDSIIIQDTIPTVEILSYRNPLYIGESDTYVFDSVRRQFFGIQNIADLLQHTGPVLINNYGTGISTISIRGTNDDHTLVLWNGIPVNSISLGTMDISLLSTEAAPSLLVITNAGANIFGSGTFGGVVALMDNTSWNNQQKVSLRTDLSGFNGYRGAINAYVGNSKIQLRSNSFYENNKGDFTYTNIYKFGQPLDTLDHNTVEQAATVNTLNWNINSKNNLYVGNWFQWKEKDIPSIMGSYQPSSKFQKDMAVRSFIKYTHHFKSADLYVSTAHIYDYLVYTDKLAPADTFLFINSNLKANRLLNSVSYRQQFNHTQFNTGTELNYVQADVSEYGKIIREFQGAFFVGMIHTYKILEINATVRQDIRPGKYIRPMFGFTAQVTTKKRIYKVGISYSDKYHAPDFNDKYWTPGGNPDLLPEKGFTAELSQEVSTDHIRNHNEKNKADFCLNFYFSKIKDEIIWKPVTGLVWSPENMQSVLHYGTETQVVFTHSLKEGNIELQLLYLYNRSVIRKNYKDNSIQNNIIAYKPQHIVKSNFQYHNKYFTGGINYIFTSKRYTDNENIEAFALKQYSLLDLYAGFSIPANPFGIDVLVRVSNLLNTSYQSIRSYAQPGRNITFSIILNFNKYHQNEN